MDRESLKQLYRDNGLNENDIFVLKRGGKDIPIITRSGIEKIQAKHGLIVSFSSEILMPDFVVIKATCGYVESYGEASPKNTQNAYPVAIAEKRAKSRAVLQVVGMYNQGFVGEDEMSSDFEYDPEPLLQLLKTSSFEGKRADQLYFDLQNLKSQDQYMKAYFMLQDAQLDAMDAPGTSMAMGDVHEQLKKQGL